MDWKVGACICILCDCGVSKEEEYFYKFSVMYWLGIHVGEQPS